MKYIFECGETINGKLEYYWYIKINCSITSITITRQRMLALASGLNFTIPKEGETKTLVFSTKYTIDE